MFGVVHRLLKEVNVTGKDKAELLNVGSGTATVMQLHNPQRLDDYNKTDDKVRLQGHL
ncbi:MAG: hypothetical protein P4L95_10145 [Rouxiella aceris]|uniref:hypothetical protein n=1 Tax=Rouxiella aceris TaxID=2703884 RepID=UPI00284F5FB5|nr:hypothetical protein [Rouxiella aceris]MDR3432242.1 hypothetical protein [Rouxiella aceris]